MTEWNNRKDHAFTVLYKLYSSPAFKGNFSDIEEFTKILKELFDVAVEDNFPFEVSRYRIRPENTTLY